MMETLTQNLSIYVIEGLILILLSWILKVSSDIRDDMHKICNRVERMEEWKQLFMKLADERHAVMQSRMTKVEEEK